MLLISRIADASTNFLSGEETSFITFTLLKIRSHLFIRFLLFYLVIHASKDSNIPTDIFVHLAYKRIFPSRFFSLGSGDG